ncbi:hypothetical protein DPMN_164532 [Dreissena polymorpha]|uniref:Uncharacterized protein n=1 Tax=Dreissena polymorpha TaxID=45954 RepID=A0A9D4ITT5_DREPO|nr:hypothetical protein DPMN_164532 [Dreissena polymorpha]
MSTVLFRHTARTFVYVSCPLLSVEHALGVRNGAVYPLQVWYYSGSCPVVDQDNRTLKDIIRIRTGCGTHEFRTNRKLTYADRTSNGGLCPFYRVENFEHAQNFPTDGTDVIGHRRTSSEFTGYETDIKRIRTNTNG